MNDTSLSAELRTRTETEHQNTENSPIMHEVLGENFSLAGYCVLLKRFMSFYIPLESAFQAFLSNATITYTYHPKLPLIHSDLAYCSDEEVQLDVTPTAVPAIDDVASFLGALYVVEGSTLGGSVIRKMLEKHMDTSQGAQFFYPYGKETKQHWDATRTFINTTAEDCAVDKNAVCNVAIATFQSIRKALDDQSIK